MSCILIFSIHTIGRHFITFFSHRNGYRSVLDPGIDRAWEQFLDLLRCRRSRDIPVIWYPSENRITHAAADRIAFISMLFQCFDDLFHIIRKCDLHSLISPFCYSVCNFSRYFHSLDVKSTELFSAIPPVSVSEQNYRNVKNKITRIPSTIRYQPKILKSCFLM